MSGEKESSSPRSARGAGVGAGARAMGSSSKACSARARLRSCARRMRALQEGGADEEERSWYVVEASSNWSGSRGEGGFGGEGWGEGVEGDSEAQRAV